MRYKIALRNLYISQAIILVFLIFAYSFWFPHSFTKLGGFYETAWMLVFVDLVLGPLLVYVIYKENKKYLMFDINVLLSIQLIAFIFGAYSLYLKHPAYAVFSVDRFILTNVSNIYPRPSWPKQINQLFLSSTKLVVAHLPKDSSERNLLIFNIVLHGLPDIDSRPKYFSDFSQHASSVMGKSIKLEELDLDMHDKEKIKLFNEKHKTNHNEFAYFPLKGNNKIDVIWAFDRKTAKPIGIIDIDPWNLKLASNSKK